MSIFVWVDNLSAGFSLQLHSIASQTMYDAIDNTEFEYAKKKFNFIYDPAKNMENMFNFNCIIHFANLRDKYYSAENIIKKYENIITRPIPLYIFNDRLERNTSLMIFSLNNQRIIKYNCNGEIDIISSSIIENKFHKILEPNPIQNYDSSELVTVSDTLSVGKLENLINPSLITANEMRLNYIAKLIIAANNAFNSDDIISEYTMCLPIDFPKDIINIMIQYLKNLNYVVEINNNTITIK